MSRPEHHRSNSLIVPVQGTSMMPTLHPGDTCQVRLGERDVRLGDIVVYRRGQGLVIHRVVWRRGDWVWTRGDALIRPDPRVRRGSILGVVVTAERQGRVISLHASGKGRYVYLVLTWCRAVVHRALTRAARMFGIQGT